MGVNWGVERIGVACGSLLEDEGSINEFVVHDGGQNGVLERHLVRYDPRGRHEFCGNLHFKGAPGFTLGRFRACYSKQAPPKMRK